MYEIDPYQQEHIHLLQSEAMFQQDFFDLTYLFHNDLQERS